MIREEAIKTLKEADTCFCIHGAFKNCHSRCKYKNALEMAINALSAIEDIKAEITENQNVVSETLKFDKEDCFYNGKWAGFELALAIIDKHIGKEQE